MLCVRVMICKSICHIETFGLKKRGFSLLPTGLIFKIKEQPFIGTNVPNYGASGLLTQIKMRLMFLFEVEGQSDSILLKAPSSCLACPTTTEEDVVSWSV